MINNRQVSLFQNSVSFGTSSGKSGLKSAFSKKFKVAVPKIEILEQPHVAIIKKDIQSITGNKNMLRVLIIVPLVMVIVVPTTLFLSVILTPVDSSDFAKLLNSLETPGLAADITDMRYATIGLLLNYVLPLFFLMIPVMASSVMAASAFVGEKEKKTLETLLYSPLPLKEIFIAKITASFLVSMFISAISFIAMLLVLEAEIKYAMGNFMVPGLTWLIMMILVSPAVSLIVINMIVRGSAKSRSSEEAQQRSVFLIFPVLLLILGQFTGIMMLSAWLFLAIGLVLAVIAILTFRGSFSKFHYENILR
jgi:ABC-type multidrug transport system permease subunit